MTPHEDRLHTQNCVRHAVVMALEYWPNAGDDDSPRELRQRAFKFLRTVSACPQCNCRSLASLRRAAGMLELDALRYEDM